MPELSGDVLDFFRDQRQIEVAAAEQSDARTIPGELYFLNRTNLRNISDHEMRARWRTQAVIADMIALDSKSAVYKMLEIKSSESEIFKIKVGTYLAESELLRVRSLANAVIASTGRVPDFIRRLLATLSQALVLGRRWRLETMLIGAKLDGFHYSRMNFQVDGGWGKSATMKVVMAIPWTDSVNATPIANIVSQIDYARVAKSQRLNRLVMSTAAFDAAVATQEFADKRQLFYNPITVDATNLPVLDREGQRTLLQRMTRVDEIVLYDAHYRWQDEQGARHLERLLPIGAVILDDSANDNNDGRVFLGNGPVLEASMIRRVGAQSYGEGAGPDDGAEGGFGPFYYTFVDEKLDPPNINARVVQRAWPIVGEPDSNAVLWVGDIQETTAVSDDW